MKKKSCFHIHFMHIAFSLAKRAKLATLPNPRVGCLIVKNGIIVSTGFHSIYGGKHAESEALRGLPLDIVGCDMYVTLEPCTGTWAEKKQAPCAESIVQSGQISRVFFVSYDPNPRVAGKGINYLRLHGIETVELSKLQGEEIRMNRDYRVLVEKKRPYIHVKIAQTLNGLMARRHAQEWISTSKSQDRVQNMRKNALALLTTAQTVNIDNPLYTIREAEYSPPLIIIDRKLKISWKSQCLVAKRKPPGVLLFCDQDYYRTKYKACKKLEQHHTLLCVPVPTNTDGSLDTRVIFSKLMQASLYHVLVEAGPYFTRYLIREDLCDTMTSIMSPQLWHTSDVQRFTLNIEHSFAQVSVLSVAKNEDIILQGES